MIEAIKKPDSHHLLAAQGWLELGNLPEAAHELEQINTAWQEHPEVLEIRWQIHARSKSWDECVRVAAAMIRANPTSAVGWIHRSYALHELQRTAEARDGLLSVVKLFPDELTILYNLACYECTLGNLPKAREWLEKIFSTTQGDEWRATALEDLDLKPLWPIIAKL